MATVVLIVLVLATVVGSSDGAWCVCKQELSTTALQKALDYACGAGADCTPIQQNGPCFQPNTVAAHCSYAANSYYQRKGEAAQACDFSGTAQLVSTDPSQNGCTYPASPSAAGSSNTTTPSPLPQTPTSPTTGGGTSLSPSSPTNGTGTGTGTGTGIGTGPNGSGTFGTLGPSGIGPDGSAGCLLPNANMGSIFLTIIISALALMVE